VGEGEGDVDSLDEDDERRGKRVDTTVTHHRVLNDLQKEYSSLSEKVERATQDLRRFKEEVTQEIVLLKRRPAEPPLMTASAPSVGGASHGGSGHGYISPSSSMYTDWRMALGELSLNLRREMSEKCGREEMRSAIGIELNLVDKKLSVRPPPLTLPLLPHLSPSVSLRP
jgi:hypothetical protein